MQCHNSSLSSLATPPIHNVLQVEVRPASAWGVTSTNAIFARIAPQPTAQAHHLLTSSKSFKISDHVLHPPSTPVVTCAHQPERAHIVRNATKALD